MAEITAKLRLVRCPKCENVLPELADYSVYQCGGCGAVLGAKKKDVQADGMSDEERVVGVPAKSDHSSEKGMVDLSDASDTDVKPNGGSLRCSQMDSEKDDVRHDERYDDQSKLTTDKWVTETGLDMNADRNESVGAMGREQGELNPEIRGASGLLRLGQMSDWKMGERGEMEGFRRKTRSDVEGVRYSTSNYPDEGPSNYNVDSSYNYGEPLTNLNDPDGANRVKYLQEDRAELLRKLDELKDQLSRSCNVVDKPKEKVPLDGRMVPPDPYSGPDNWFQNGSSVSNRQFPDKHVTGPPYSNHWPDPYPYTNRHEVAMHSHGFYPSMHNPGYGDPFGSQMLRRNPHQLAGQYPQQPLHQYYSGQYIDTNPDSFEPYPPNSVFHQPSCPCLHCYDKLHRVSAPVRPPSFCNKRFPDVPNNPAMYHYEKLGAFGPCVHNSRTMIPPSNISDAQRHTRWPSDFNPEMGGFVRCHPRRVVLASGGRHRRPIAGGAPFLTCYNCFGLLQLPKKVLLTVRNQQKMRCGACSAVINFAVVNKKLVLSLHAETKDIPIDVDGSSNEVVRDSAPHFQSHMNRISANFSSDYDDSGYDFQSIDREPVSLPTGLGLNSNKAHENFHSSSPSTSDEENGPEVLIASKEVNNSTQGPIRAILSPPPPGSPLQDHFDYSSNNHAVNRLGKGNRSSRSDQEKVKPNKAASRQNSLKEVSLATEMEVSFNEYSNTGVSQDSGDAGREDDQPRNKGGDSFFANIIKKSFKDLSRSSQTDERGRSNISVNGHLIPERVVKKAEKQAGQIHPGKYWYDFRAGFWGVIGGPCLGIIPPFIEEFNYSMPENCAGGNTGVFVNGRELHQKDLDLLASRGLPTARDRSYIIEISGRVLDEDTGEELDSLGKLAPTVEKARHGFGMKASRAAQSQ
nr:protein ENHANCED DISEASE RESISTANCE 4-like isoform X2 [Quercus suber]